MRSEFHTSLRRCGVSVASAVSHEVWSAMSDLVPGAWHQPVMVEEALRGLNPQPGAVIVDATLGTGGHSLAILPHLLPNGRLIALDRDSDTLSRARQRLIEFASVVTFAHDDFRHLRRVLDHLELSGVDGVLLDVGMSSVQLNDPARGFSFSHDGPLDMRMNAEQTLTARTLVHTFSAEELAALLEQFGEERFAARIARRIVQERHKHPIATTAQLARIVCAAVPGGSRHGRVHAATRTFQALRIAVNDELGALEACLDSLSGLLRPGGRAVIITFHSLEDRLVKRRFAEGAREGVWTLLTKKPLRASETEVSRNPRARSAKLRAVERRA